MSIFEDVLYIDPQLSAPIVAWQEHTRRLEPLKGKIFCDGTEYVRLRVAVYGAWALLTYNYHSLKRWRMVHSHWSPTKGFRTAGGVQENLDSSTH